MQPVYKQFTRHIKSSLRIMHFYILTSDNRKIRINSFHLKSFSCIFHIGIFRFLYKKNCMIRDTDSSGALHNFVGHISFLIKSFGCYGFYIQLIFDSKSLSLDILYTSVQRSALLLVQFSAKHYKEHVLSRV